ncbi:hypothetical protein OIE69_44060 (plasmid) [Actinacidiphila glaucinigra]|uniref:hypothetical protein n=1 Tax=Actinacidiphila glaucinigra TaxID=235986 RepID=UPI002DDC8005|nr:hypothetical protein [Actinacidiphila glaucinigra]WSD65881.1 hypothetical protein OIE69_44060 [Actinacidiphila glaucinigra]
MMEIDWGNPGFLRLYALVFGLSAALTMIMWLISVVKRAIRGVSLGQALMENIGYLMLSVTVSAFAPAVVAYAVDFSDTAANAILGDYLPEVISGGAAIVSVLVYISSTVPAAAIITIPILMAIVLAILGLWVMLVVRNAMILMGLICGPVVFGGLVDKDLWSATRRWAGIMGGLIASKFGIYLALALAGALLDGIDFNRLSIPQAMGVLITFCALLYMALIMPFQIAKWLPLVGDELQNMHQMKSDAAARHRSTKAGMQDADNDMKASAAKRKGGGGAPGAEAAGPAAAASAIKDGVDDAREQTTEAIESGTENAGGEPQASGSDGPGQGSGPSPEGPQTGGGDGPQDGGPGPGPGPQRPPATPPPGPRPAPPTPPPAPPPTPPSVPTPPAPAPVA